MDESKVPVKDQKPESIRQWYERTTRRSRIALGVATAASFIVMGILWKTCDLETLKFAQTFNGALTMVLLGGLWVFAFIFQFLRPSREASFRAQETLESGIGFIWEAVEKKLLPAIEIWQRVGLQIEKEYPEIRKKLEESVLDLKKTSECIQKAVEDNGSFVSEARPVLLTLKRIEERIEEDLLDDVKLMTEAVKRMSGVPPVQASKPVSAPIAPAAAAAVPEATPEVPLAPVVVPPAREPSLGVALSSIRKRKEAASVQPK